MDSHDPIPATFHARGSLRARSKRADVGDDSVVPRAIGSPPASNRPRPPGIQNPNSKRSLANCRLPHGAQHTRVYLLRGLLGGGTRHTRHRTDAGTGVTRYRGLSPLDSSPSLPSSVYLYLSMHSNRPTKPRNAATRRDAGALHRRETRFYFETGKRRGGRVRRRALILLSDCPLT